MTGNLTLERRPHGLLRQIAIRLTLLMAVFALLDIAIVIPIYAFDQQALAEDMIEQQADRIDRAIEGHDTQSGQAAALAGLGQPFGVAKWGFVVFDSRQRPFLERRDPGMLVDPEWPQATTLDWTHRSSAAGATLVSGIRRVKGPVGDRWILVETRVTGSRAYWPVIGQELLEHVALPLAPLTLLLLVFSVQVVRRLIAPLEGAAREVDTLEPGHMEARLSTPQTSREVATLVSAMNRALDRLQAAMQLLKTFTADAAHELRTPLAVLRLRIDALPDSPGKHDLGEDIQTMTRLVNQMLDLAQADALRMESPEFVDLKNLAETVVAQTAPLAFSHGQQIQIIDRGGAAIPGHLDALGRAMRNLIENAIHHSNGSKPIEVIVGPGPQFSVRDHGVGLAEGMESRIFDRFWRMSRSREVGAGLGLGIVRSIVQAHSGRVTARNAEGGGALFLCEFDRAEPGIETSMG